MGDATGLSVTVWHTNPHVQILLAHIFCFDGCAADNVGKS